MVRNPASETVVRRGCVFMVGWLEKGKRPLSKSCLPPDTALTVAGATRAKAAISATLVLK